MSIEAIQQFTGKLKATIADNSAMSDDAKGELLAQVDGFELALDGVLDKGCVTIVSEFDNLRKGLKITSDLMREEINRVFEANKTAHDEMLGEKEAA
ncbi:MAG: hypothetical protein ABJA10_02695 [Aestuariivirga sp.]